MGVLYHYVCHTRLEMVTLSGLRSGGDKEGAALIAGGALVWLMMSFPQGLAFRGRWRGGLVEVVDDAATSAYARQPWLHHTPTDITWRVDVYGPDCLIGCGTTEYTDITPGLLAELKAEYPELFGAWTPHPGYRPWQERGR